MDGNPEVVEDFGLTDEGPKWRYPAERDAATVAHALHASRHRHEALCRKRHADIQRRKRETAQKEKDDASSATAPRVTFEGRASDKERSDHVGKRQRPSQPGSTEQCSGGPSAQCSGGPSARRSGGPSARCSGGASARCSGGPSAQCSGGPSAHSAAQSVGPPPSRRAENSQWGLLQPAKKSARSWDSRRKQWRHETEETLDGEASLAGDAGDDDGDSGLKPARRIDELLEACMYASLGGSDRDDTLRSDHSVRQRSAAGFGAPHSSADGSGSECADLAGASSSMPLDVSRCQEGSLPVTDWTQPTREADRAQRRPQTSSISPVGTSRAAHGDAVRAAQLDAGLGATAAIHAAERHNSAMCLYGRVGRLRSLRDPGHIDRSALLASLFAPAGGAIGSGVLHHGTAGEVVPSGGPSSSMAGVTDGEAPIAPSNRAAAVTNPLRRPSSPIHAGGVRSQDGRLGSAPQGARKTRGPAHRAVGDRAGARARSRTPSSPSYRRIGRGRGEKRRARDEDGGAAIALERPRARTRLPRRDGSSKASSSAPEPAITRRRLASDEPITRADRQRLSSLEGYRQRDQEASCRLHELLEPEEYAWRSVSICTDDEAPDAHLATDPEMVNASSTQGGVLMQDVTLMRTVARMQASARSKRAMNVARTTGRPMATQPFESVCIGSATCPEVALRPLIAQLVAPVHSSTLAFPAPPPLAFPQARGCLAVVMALCGARVLGALARRAPHCGAY